jgi:hypothetical protein
VEIQSLSVVVPGGCPNACKFCVSKLHREEYPNRIEGERASRDLYERDWIERLQFARDNGCNTLILTGSGETGDERGFPGPLLPLGTPGSPIPSAGSRSRPPASPGRREAPLALRIDRVSTVALSLSNGLSSEGNADYGGIPEKLRFDIDELCARVKEAGFNLRLCLNMTDAYEGAQTEAIFHRCASLGADQVTFRVLYDVDSSLSPAIHDWIVAHRASEERIGSIKEFIRERGRPLERLPYGAMRFSVMGMSTVLDDDCMSTKADAPATRYLILRPDCRLYTKWDDKGSKLF